MSEQPRQGSRWPGSVFEAGDEPDPRFTFANERTFLAWVRTSLALTAAGVAVHSLAEAISGGMRTVLALVLVLLGAASGGFAFLRWTANERALRLRRPLPGFAMGALLSVGLLVCGVLVIVELVRAG